MYTLEVSDEVSNDGLPTGCKIEIKGDPELVHKVSLFILDSTFKDVDIKVPVC